jgi:hypothetical protein
MEVGLGIRVWCLGEKEKGRRGERAKGRITINAKVSHLEKSKSKKASLPLTVSWLATV